LASRKGLPGFKIQRNGGKQFAGFFNGLSRFFLADSMHGAIVTGISQVKGVENVTVKAAVKNSCFDELLAECRDDG